MKKATYTTGQIPWNGSAHDIRSYRIEIDTSKPDEHFQRHIWTFREGGIEESNWERAGLYDQKWLEENMKRVTQ